MFLPHVQVKSVKAGPSETLSLVSKRKNPVKRHITHHEEKVKVVRMPDMHKDFLTLVDNVHFTEEFDSYENEFKPKKFRSFSCPGPISSALIYRSNGPNVSSFHTSHPTKHQQRFIVKSREMHAYFRLLEDHLIQDFLDMDNCMRISDKYLLAMVFAFFKRAELQIKEYTRMNFFIALYLANDMEEDEEEDKYEIFPWALGQKWKNRFPKFLRKRDLFWAKINYKAVVSKRCCEEIISIQSDHHIWKRNRPVHHSGAVRAYMRDPDDDGYPRGPNASPRHCLDCDQDCDSQYDSASPASFEWYISSDDSSPTTKCNSKLCQSSSFNMKGLQSTLPESSAEWPTCEE